MAASDFWRAVHLHVCSWNVSKFFTDSHWKIQVHQNFEDCWKLIYSVCVNAVPKRDLKFTLRLATPRTQNSEDPVRTLHHVEILHILLHNCCQVGYPNGPNGFSGDCCQVGYPKGPNRFSGAWGPKHPNRFMIWSIDWDWDNKSMSFDFRFHAVIGSFFYPWPFRTKGYCRCLRVSVRLSVNLPCPHDTSSHIWSGITKFALNMHHGILAVGIENRGHWHLPSRSF